METKTTIIDAMNAYIDVKAKNDAKAASEEAKQNAALFDNVVNVAQEHPDLFQQMVNISKAHAYDITVQQVQQLKELIRVLLEVGELEDLKFTDPADTAAFQRLVKQAQLLSL